MTKRVNPSASAPAPELGAEAGNVRTISADWIKYMKQGVIVELHITRWRAVTRLTLDDLGLTDSSTEEEQALSELTSLGEKFLLPAEIISACNNRESSARQRLSGAGFKTFWGFFLPLSRYLSYKAEALEKDVTPYLEIRDDLYNRWEEIRVEILQKYAVAARAAYRRSCKLSGVEIAGYRENLFTDAFLARIASALPDKEAVYNSFSMTIDPQYVPLPGQIRELEAEAESLRDEAAGLRDEAALEREVKKEVLAAVERQKEELIGGFMRDLVSQLQNTAYNAVYDVLETIKRNDSTLHPRSVIQLTNLVKNVAALNFWNDPDLAGMIDRVKEELQKSPEEREAGTIRERLIDISTVTRAALAELGEAPRLNRKSGADNRISAADLGLPEVLTGEVVRKARASLRLDTPEEAAAIPLLDVTPRRGRIVEPAEA